MTWEAVVGIVTLSGAVVWCFRVAIQLGKIVQQAKDANAKIGLLATEVQQSNHRVTELAQQLSRLIVDVQYELKGIRADLSHQSERIGKLESWRNKFTGELGS